MNRSLLPSGDRFMSCFPRHCRSPATSGPPASCWSHVHLLPLSPTAQDTFWPYRQGEKLAIVFFPVGDAWQGRSQKPDSPEPWWSPTSFPQCKDSSPFTCTALTCSDSPLMHDGDLQMQHSSHAVIIHRHRSFDAWKGARRRVRLGGSLCCNTFRVGRSPRAPPPSPLCGRDSP